MPNTAMTQQNHPASRTVSGIHAPAARVTLTAAFLSASVMSAAFLMILAAFKLALVVSMG